MPKAINIMDQPRLGLAKTFNLTVNGIRYRVFRSAVTVVVITVAIAFMMNIVAENLIKSAMVDHAKARLEKIRIEAFWTSRLMTPESSRAILMKWASAPDDSPEIAESARFGKFNDKETVFLLEHAPSAEGLIAFVESLDYGRQRLLVRRNSGLDIISHLSDPENMERFKRNFEPMRGLRLPVTDENLNSLISAWPRVLELISRVRNGHADAIVAVKRDLKGARLFEGLRHADGAFGEAVRNAGFEFSSDTASELARNARATATIELVDQTLDNQSFRRAVAVRRDLLPQEITSGDVWTICQTEAGAAWVIEQLRQIESLSWRIEPDTAAMLRFISDRNTEERRLANVEKMEMEVGERMWWLILLSMIVCVVGISNAMLMSVTERYREIATFKCLGALDSSIMLIFVIEASLLGLVGGIVGSIAGSVLGLGGMILRFGALAFTNFPLDQMLLGLLFSIFVGVFLAAAAAIFPSFKAARLAPMEAMRIE
ncbi:MAG: ABC transporter permease [Victivallales bacterium]|nr:ABC transporter permease [Victivallales bacterium]